MCSSISLYANTSSEGYIQLRYDRMLHFQAGMMTSMCFTMWSKKIGFEEDYGIAGVGVAFLLGYLKEFTDYRTLNFVRWNNCKYDRNDGYWDLFSTVMGGICGKFMTYTF